MIQFDDVLSVYSGKPHTCCCGCAGKHYYREDLIEEGTKSRGYEVDKEECSNRMVRRVINILNKDPNTSRHDWGSGNTYYTTDTATRMYTAYLRKS